MNELIALDGTKADGRFIGAVRERSNPARAVRAQRLRGPAHGLVKNQRQVGARTVLARAQVYVVHCTTGRLRVKVPRHKNDEAFFAELRRELLKQRGISSVDVNSLTASVLILHDGTLDLRPGEGQQPRKDGASGLDVRARKATGEPASRDADLTSLAIKLALVAITPQLSCSAIAELYADVLVQMVYVMGPEYPRLRGSERAKGVHDRAVWRAVPT